MEQQQRRLEGKVALITGAAGGQGAADAHLFAREGASLVLTDIDEGRGQELVEAIRGDGGRALFVRQDVAEPASWVEAVGRAQAEFGGLHVLVNNAGTISRNGIAEISLDAWERTMAINLTGPMLGMQHAAPAIRDSGGGSIINVCSTASFTAHYDAAYTASKWALRGLTKTAAIEFVGWNIRVNSIHPSLIAATSFATQGLPGHAEAGRMTIPMQRLGTPEECADLVLFLASDESRFITGAEIAIDGGYSAGAALWMRTLIRNEVAARESGEVREGVAR